MTSERDHAAAQITEAPIDLAGVGPESTDRDSGAVVLFAGRVRARNEGREVVGLEYDAYPEMARAVLLDIVGEARERFGVESVDVSHRTGTLRVGDVSVAIAVRSAHRADAYDASRYVIEQIKVRLPVWKRELYADGTSRWLDGVPQGRPESGEE